MIVGPLYEGMFIFPKVPGRTFFPNLSKTFIFATAPLVLTPFLRNQFEVSFASSRGTEVARSAVPGEFIGIFRSPLFRGPSL